MHRKLLAVGAAALAIGGAVAPPASATDPVPPPPPGTPDGTSWNGVNATTPGPPPSGTAPGAADPKLGTSWNDRGEPGSP